MRYFAILQPGSAIYRLWRHKSQRSGIIDHVTFFWRGKQYESDELTAEQVAVLSVRGALDMSIEAMGVTPDEDELSAVEADNQVKKPRTRQRL